jgi:hypothetical protein
MTTIGQLCSNPGPIFKNLIVIVPTQKRAVADWRPRKEDSAFMTDRIKIICSNCRKPFSERANRLKNGYQVQCPNCMRLITFDSSSEDPNIRRPLKAARDIRNAAEDALVMARRAAQEPKRDTGY